MKIPPILKTAAITASSALLGGLLVLHYAPKPDISEEVEKILTARSGATSIELALTRDGTPLTTDGSCAANQTFAPMNAAPDYLDSKVGFHYEIEDITHVKRPGTPNSRLGLFYDTFGTETTFAIWNSYPHAQEVLLIYNEVGKLTRGTSIKIYDNNRDGIVDRIDLSDKEQHTEALIVRNKQGILEYTFLDEKSARQLYDLYAQTYRTFKKEHDIDARIAAYTPSLQIIQIDPRTVPGGE